MPKSKTKDDIRALLTSALTEYQAAKPYRPEENPLAHLELKDLSHGKGILKAADQHPALNMAAKLAGLDGERDDLAAIAHNTDQARRAGLEEGKKDLSAKRTAANRQRAERKAQIDALIDSPIVPSPERMTKAWEVVAPLADIVDKIARSKRAWASRFLGSIADDIGQMAIEKMALVMAKDDTRDLDILSEAARELAGITTRTGRLPGDQVVDVAERKHRKKVGKARKWLMGMANNRVMGALVDAYTSQKNLRWENIDLIATVMASINGVGDDPMVNATKASRAPAMLGSRGRRPDSFDPEWLAEVVSAAITHRGLDRMVELLLDDERRRTNGSFKWASNAEAVFMATPAPVLLGAGPSQVAGLEWSLLVSRTEKLGEKAARAARADAARDHVRRLFGFLPSVIMAAVEAFDFEATERYAFAAEGRVTDIQARISSSFERMIEKGERTVIRPALTYATPRDAAMALVEYLSVLVSGQDLAESIAYA